MTKYCKSMKYNTLVLFARSCLQSLIERKNYLERENSDPNKEPFISDLLPDQNKRKIFYRHLIKSLEKTLGYPKTLICQKQSCTRCSVMSPERNYRFAVETSRCNYRTRHRSNGGLPGTDHNGRITPSTATS